MPDSAIILAGLSDAFSPVNFAFVILGVVIGQFVGAVPGIGPVMAMAIAVPFTFGLDTLPAIAFLIGVNKGGLVGGAVPAVLMNTPGTPDAAATALDGYPMARQGKPLKATKMALFSSVTGDLFSDMVLITVSAPLAVLALRMGPVEIVALMVFAFSVLAGLVGSSPVKGVIAAAFGLILACVGSDPENYTPRLIFGIWDLYDGLPLASVAIGMLAISEILRRISIAGGNVGAVIAIAASGDPADRRVSWAEYWGCRYVMLRGAVTGTLLGALPGIGSTAAAFISYALTKAAARDSGSFGKGDIRGIAAALIVSAFMIHGLQPGPLLFENQGRLVYGLFGAMLMANFVNLWVGQVGLRLWVRVMAVPRSVIFAAAILLCIAGVAMAAGSVFGVMVMLLFASLGYLMASFGYPLVIVIMPFFLGPRLEISIAQSLALTRGDPAALLDHPVAIALLLLSVVSAVYLAKRTRLADG